MLNVFEYFSVMRSGIAYVASYNWDHSLTFSDFSRINRLLELL